MKEIRKEWGHFIHGKSVSGVNGQIEVFNPSTGQLLAKTARATAQDVDQAVGSAARCFTSWKNLATDERAALQLKAADAMREAADELSFLLASELGRPLAGCKNEIIRSADLLSYYAEEGKRMYGQVTMNRPMGEKAMILRQPVGVVAAITPFNYPITLLCFKLGAALIAGCTVVAKPSEDTPLSTLRLAELFQQVGYPDGAFNVLCGYGKEIGDALVSHPQIRKVAFTGGSKTGAHIASLAASLHKRLTLELGGQSPAIVCEDADVETAAKAIVKHAFANSGQFCYRVNRVYVHASLYADFLSRAKALTEALHVANAFHASCDLGPMVNENIFSNSVRQTDDALAKGATLLSGGKRLAGQEYDQGWYFPPTLLADTTHQMEIMTQETFGPVLGVMPFDEEAEALALANDSEYGLAAYVFANNVGRALRLAESLEAGSVWINDIRRSYHNVPFGGVKSSGVGREKGAYGIASYTELKTIYLTY